MTLQILYERLHSHQSRAEAAALRVLEIQAQLELADGVEEALPDGPSVAGGIEAGRRVLEGLLRLEQRILASAQADLVADREELNARRDEELAEHLP